MSNALTNRLRALSQELRQEQPDEYFYDWCDYDMEIAAAKEARRRVADSLEALLSAHEAPQPAHEAATPAAQDTKVKPLVQRRMSDGVIWIDGKQFSGEQALRIAHDIIELTSLRSHHEAAPVERPEGWQPIETAPKNGTSILLGAAAWTLPGIGQWRGHHWRDDIGSLYKSPTHWMPLPALPPSTERKS